MKTRHMTCSFTAPAARRADRHRSTGLMAVSCFLIVAATASADDVTVTTYYPSPRGVFEELRATGETRLATQTGGVVIGSGYATTAAPADGLIVEGNVGIGAPAPGGSLHVLKPLDDGAPAVRVDDQAGDPTPFAISETGSVQIGHFDPPAHSLLEVWDAANYTGSHLAIYEDTGAAQGNQMAFLGAGASNLEIYGPQGVDGNKVSHNNEIFYDADGHHFRRSDLGPCCPDLMTILPSGQVGIGTDAPGSRLSVAGGASIGSGYATTQAAPANGLIIEGRVGVGAPIPSQPLHVSGNALIESGQVRLGNFDEDPAAIGNGAMYYNTASDTFRGFQGGAWADLAGAGLQSLQVFTSNGTWHKPAGISRILVEVYGGGGGGGEGDGSSLFNGGGGAGGGAERLMDVSAIDSVGVTIGAGGAAVYPISETGGTSHFGAFVSATGGTGGITCAHHPPSDDPPSTFTLCTGGYGGVGQGGAN